MLLKCSLVCITISIVSFKRFVGITTGQLLRSAATWRSVLAPTLTYVTVVQKCDSVNSPWLHVRLYHLTFMNEVCHRACSVWEYRSYYYIACCEWCCLQMLSSHERSCWLVWEMGWGHIRGTRKGWWSRLGRGYAVGSGPVEACWDAMWVAEVKRWYVWDASAAWTVCLCVCVCTHQWST